MLKKLVKYGNSNALVLDRSILALLGLDEDSIVRLRVEGDRLVIRAAEAEEVRPTDAWMLEVENLHRTPHWAKSPVGSPNSIQDIAEANIRNYCKKVENDPDAMKSLKEWMPGTDNEKKLREAYGVVMQKYMADIMKLGSKEFRKEADALIKKYNGDSTSKEFSEKYQALRLKYAPRLAEMYEEMKAVNKSLGAPAALDMF